MVVTVPGAVVVVAVGAAVVVAASAAVVVVDWRRAAAPFIELLPPLPSPLAAVVVGAAVVGATVVAAGSTAVVAVGSVGTVVAVGSVTVGSAAVAAAFSSSTICWTVTPSGIFSSSRSAAICSSASFGGAAVGAANTGRNRSSAVLPTRSRTRFWSLMPGSWTTIVVPWIVMSGSPTPIAFTRVSMTRCVCSSASWLTLVCFFPALTGWRTTETPPWRSRPRLGVKSARITARQEPSDSTVTRASGTSPFFFFMRSGVSLSIVQGRNDDSQPAEHTGFAVPTSGIGLGPHVVLNVIRPES